MKFRYLVCFLFPFAFAHAEQVTVEVQSTVYDVSVGGTGPVASAADFNGSGTSLAVGDQIRSVITYETNAVASSLEMGDPDVGDIGDNSTYLSAVIVKAEHFKGNTVLESTETNQAISTLVSLSDSFTPGIGDSASISTSFVYPVQSAFINPWGINFMAQPGGGNPLSSVTLPSPFPSTGWQTGGPPGDRLSLVLGSFKTSSTTPGFANFTASVSNLSTSSNNGEITVTLDATLENLWVGGTGFLNSISDVNGSGVTVNDGDTLSVEITYDPATQAAFEIMGNPNNGDPNNTGSYGGAGATGAMTDFVIKKGNTDVAGFSFGTVNLNSVTIMDSYTPQRPDEIAFQWRLMEDFDNQQPWSFTIVTPKTVQTQLTDTTLPDPFPTTGWAIGTAQPNTTTIISGAGLTNSTTPGFVNFSAYATSITSTTGGGGGGGGGGGDDTPQDFLRAVEIVSDLNNNGAGDVAGIRVTDAFAIQVRVADGQSGAIIRDYSFFNPSWKARELITIPGIASAGRDALGLVATRVSDDLPGIQIKDAASSAAIRTLSPWSSAWDLVDVDVVEGVTATPLVATLAERKSDGLPGLELRDPLTGARHSLIYPLGFGWTPKYLAVLDVNGPAVATLHTRDTDGLTIVQVRNASNGNFIRNVFPLGLGWSPEELRIVPDRNSNGADEVAVRMTRDSDGLEIIQIRDGQTQALISNVYPIGAGLGAWDTQRFDVAMTNGSPALAIVSVRDSDGQVLVQLKDIQAGTVINNVFFIGTPWEFQQDFAVMPNFSGGDDDELAVLMRNTTTDQRFVQIRDSQTDAVIRNVFQPNE